MSALLSTYPVDVVAISESWLHKNLDDSLLSINSYNLFRKDRINSRGGGICAYLKYDIPCTQRLDLENNDFEVLWLCLRPKRLPRPISGIAVCIVYHPPGLSVLEHKDLNNYLINSADFIRNKYPDHGLVILGDFNDFKIGNLTSNQNLKQVVDHPTRGLATLDLIITNLHKFYNNPTILAPFGSSDHSIVHWFPPADSATINNTSVKPVKHLVCRYPRSGIDAFGRWITTQNWFSELSPNPTVDSLAVSLTYQLTQTTKEGKTPSD